jgi:hypothetical protein
VMLYRDEKVFDNPAQVLGPQWQDTFGRFVIVDGERRYLSGQPRPKGHDPRQYSKLFSAEVATIPRSSWSAAIKEQWDQKRATSQIQNWNSDDQGSHPTCWAAGTCQAFATARVRQGHPHVYISAMSVACPISGGSSGGYEGDAVELLTKRGGVSTDLWGYTEISRSKDSDQACEANRQLHKALESYECNNFDEFATAWLLGFPCTISYNWWSHVVMGCDLVEIESNSFGVRIRNNWGDSYGAKNDFGVGGYAVFREGHGTPSDGFAFRQVTASVK